MLAGYCNQRVKDSVVTDAETDCIKGNAVYSHRMLCNMGWGVASLIAAQHRQASQLDRESMLSASSLASVDN